MANLKGADFLQQIRDAKIRLDARGIKRYGENRNSALAHSHRILENRVQILKRFAQYLESIGFVGKLNRAITLENMSNFFEQEIVSMSSRSREMFFSSYANLVKGLRSKNITINVDVNFEFFQRCKDKYFGRPDDQEYQVDRYINPEHYNEMEQKIAPRSRLVFHLQYNYGFRSSEAVKIGKNIEQYVKNDVVTGVRGKGGQVYPDKIVKEHTYKLFEENGKGISLKQYLSDKNGVLIKNRPHDLRLSFAVNLFRSLVLNGVSENEAHLIVSKEMNHHRKYMSIYYLDRA